MGSHDLAPFPARPAVQLKMNLENIENWRLLGNL
jgi:hypothetical protein